MVVDESMTALPRTAAVIGLVLAASVVGATTGAAPEPPGELARLVPDVATIENRYVSDVAIHWNMAAYGAPLAVVNGVPRGAVYMFGMHGGEWVVEQTVVPDDVGSVTRFGDAVALDGNTLFVGAYRSAGLKGATFVFHRIGQAWIQQARLQSDEDLWLNAFGWSVDVDGDVAIVGAMGIGERRGSAYIFRRSGHEWREEARLTSSHVGSPALFGWSVAIQGDIALVGAPGLFFNQSFPRPGRVTAFHRTSAGWEEGQVLMSPDPCSVDEFGVSLDLDDEFAVIGSTGACTFLEGGRAHVFRRNNRRWSTVAEFSAPSDLRRNGFGGAVAIKGGLIAVGAERQDTSGPDCGGVFLYRRAGDRWALNAEVSVDGTGERLRFGHALDLHGDRLVVAAPGSASIGDPVFGFASIFGGLRTPSDVDGDGVVDGRDLVLLLASWGECPGCAADVNDDGAVSVDDLLTIIKRPGQERPR